MGGVHLPEGRVEWGRWGLKQATTADVLLATVVGLSVLAALARAMGALTPVTYSAMFTIGTNWAASLPSSTTSTAVTNMSAVSPERIREETMACAL